MATVLHRPEKGKIFRRQLVKEMSIIGIESIGIVALYMFLVLLK